MRLGGTWPLAILCYFWHWWGPTERRTATDWTRFDAMTDEEVRKAALSDTDAQPLSRRQLAKMRRASPVKRLRWKLGLSPTEFAERFHIPVGTGARLGATPTCTGPGGALLFEGHRG
jgi:hypothetical protein